MVTLGLFLLGDTFIVLYLQVILLLLLKLLFWTLFFITALIMHIHIHTSNRILL